MFSKVTYSYCGASGISFLGLSFHLEITAKGGNSLELIKLFWNSCNNSRRKRDSDTLPHKEVLCASDIVPCPQGKNSHSRVRQVQASALVSANSSLAGRGRIR